MVSDRAHTALLAAADRPIAFGRYRLFRRQRLLLDGEKPVRLGSRALDILIALVEHPGEVIGKEELIARAWPGTHVDESNLKFQIGMLRRAVEDGSRYVATAPGRGYCFVAPVHIEEAPAPVPVTRARPIHNLPVGLTTVIGRDEACERILRLIARYRLVTIVGTGGVGKTSLALAVAQRLLSDYPDGVWFVDLSQVDASGAVPSALASVLGLEIRSADPMSSLAISLRSRRTLLLLDNCTRLVEAAADLALTLLRDAPGVRILATSREPLRIEGERLQRLDPLSCPEVADGLTGQKAIESPAVRLFVERAAENLGDFELSEADAPLVAQICRQLDGIPLAIELAAARVGVFGVRGLAVRLHDHLHILTRGPRNAAPRHRTMNAVLDWSYNLLTESEKTIFRRFAIFAGSFTLAAAVAVASDVSQQEAEIVDCMTELVDKSLVVADPNETEPRLRLLETTRTYALEKLAESGEREQLARRHAEYYRDLFEQSEAEWQARPGAEWLTDYKPQINNLRAALEWAFSPQGDASLGVALTTAAVPLWFQLSFLEECRRRAEQSLAAVKTSEEHDERREMKLQAALGASLIYTGRGGADVPVVWKRALEIAESLGDVHYQIISLWGLWAYHVNGVQYRTALALARRFSSLAVSRTNSNDRLVGERMIAISYHFLGDQTSARYHIEQALADTATDSKRQIPRLELDPQVTAHVHLARILWLQGFPDQATHAAEQSIEHARATQHAISLNYALHRGACPVALWNGDLSTASRYADMLLDHATRHALGRWQLYGRGYQGAVAIRRGDIATGLRLLRSCFEELGETGVAAPRFMRFAAAYMAEALGRAGQTSDALVAIDDAIGRAKRTEERWQFAELLRVKGELLLLRDAPAAADDYFHQALDCARRQGALSWELRVATSLAKLISDRGRSAESFALLQPVYDRFTEGSNTADLQAARHLLEQWT